MSKRKIYLASSWRNLPKVKEAVEQLRDVGHEVYDFTEIPFQYSDVDPNWQNWSVVDYCNSFNHPTVIEGFERDQAGLEWCDTLVLLLPCGRSAHLEAGYAIGARKDVFAVIEQKQEPELMYGLMTGIVLSVKELIETIAVLDY